MYDSYLSHHGIKGQKWGVRRYQNSDGSLTEEGRRRYGYGPLMSENTAHRTKQGAKIGAAVGGAIGTVGLGVLATAGTLGSGGMALAIGSGYLATAVASGALDGVRYGFIVGAIETKMGRDYMRENNIKIPKNY